MPADPHNKTMRELILIGKSFGFRVYASHDVGEATIQLPRTIDTTVLSSVDQIDVVWFDNHNFPKYAFEIEYTSGVDRGMHRLFQLRHYLDCKLFVVIEERGANTTAYRNKFDKLKESDPYVQITDRFSLLTNTNVNALLKKALELDRLKYNFLEWDLNEDIVKLVSKEVEVEGRVPSWVAQGEANWGRHFTSRKEYARSLFVSFVEKMLLPSDLGLEVRILKWHISVYKGTDLKAVVNPRKDKLIFQMKNIEDQYDGVNVEMVDKTPTDYIIPSATKYLFLKSEDDFDDFMKLLRIAVSRQ